MAVHEVMQGSELWVGEMRPLSLEGQRVLLLRTDQGVFAYEDRCLHLGVRLSLGTLAGCTLSCGAHDYQYDANTGAGKNPSTGQLKTYPVRCERGLLLIEVNRADAPAEPE
jgi:toluene monooxygenase system ferredoxin subunit